MKFKAGDRVRINNEKSSYFSSHGTVISYRFDDRRYRVTMDIDGRTMRFAESSLELADGKSNSPAHIEMVHAVICIDDCDGEVTTLQDFEPFLISDNHTLTNRVLELIDLVEIDTIKVISAVCGSGKSYPLKLSVGVEIGNE